MVVERVVSLPVVAPKGYPRGKIEGFSDEAARRLREFCVTQDVTGRRVLATTCTVHRPLTADEWQAAVKRFRTQVVRKGWAGVFRVELQRRKVPHLHSAFWLPDGVTVEDVRDLWLECTGETQDPDAFKHAVAGKWIQSAGWVIYMALHNGKKKADQLGWKGKQWGVWNRKLFEERAPSTESRELSRWEEATFRRVLRRMFAAQHRARVAALFSQLSPRVTLNARVYVGRECPMVHTVASVSARMEMFRQWNRLRKMPPARVPRGAFLRCLPGLEVDRLLQAFRVGTVAALPVSVRS